MLSIDILDEAAVFIQKLSEKHQNQIAEKINLLARNPFPIRSKQIEGFAPFRRLRSGAFRIVYFVDKSMLKVILVDRRNDDKVYRRLKNLFK